MYGGWWSKMTLLERGVWLVLLANSDYCSGIVRDLSQQNLGKLAGCNNLNRMRDAIRRIETFGLMETEDCGGGFGKKSRRRMLSPKPYWGNPLFDQAEAAAALEIPDEMAQESSADEGSTGPVTGPVDGESYGAGDRPSTGPVSESYGAGDRPSTGPVSGPLYHISPKHTPHHGPAPSRAVSQSRGFTAKEEEVRKFLASKGIWESSARKLATLVTLEQAMEIWKGVVADTSVRNRKAALFVRLREFTEHQPTANEAQAS